MSPEAWQSLRWLIAVAVLGLVVVVTIPLTIDALSRSVVFDEEDDDVDISNGDAADDGADGETVNGTDDTATPAAGPVEDGQAVPDFDFVVSTGTVGQVTDQRLEVGDTETVVLVFEPVDGDPACVAEAELSLDLLEATPAEIGASVSSLTVTDEPSSGDEVPDELESGEEVSLAATDGTPGTLRWDATELYAEWAESPRGQFVVAVRPTVADPETYLAFASGEAGEAQAPLLTWTGEPGCGAEETEGADETGDTEEAEEDEEAAGADQAAGR